MRASSPIRGDEAGLPGALVVSWSILVAAATLTCTAGRADEPIVGLPCEGCEAVYQGLPATLDSSARIAPEGEPGEPLIIEGTVRGPDGEPRAGIIVYAYHTNAAGRYPSDAEAPGAAARRHGRLRAWARTGEHGEFRFVTIRPGGYPGREDPQHVHLHVLEPGRCSYFIDSLLFDDDPRLTPARRALPRPNRGGSGLATPTLHASGIWTARRDIVLGLNVPGYEGCEAEARVRGPSEEPAPLETDA